MSFLDEPRVGGRARVERDAGGLRIVIRARREAWLLAFLFFWALIWTAGGTSVAVFRAFGDGGAGGQTTVLAFWLAAWALGMLVLAAVLGWTLLGREIVTVTPGSLTVARAAGPYRRARSFTRDRIERLRTEPYQGVLRSMARGPLSWRWRHDVEVWGLGGGSIVFDAEGRTHRFGSKLEAGDAAEIGDLVRRELGLPQTSR